MQQLPSNPAERTFKMPPTPEPAAGQAMLEQSIHRAIDVLQRTPEAGIVRWDGQELRVYTIISRKANQMLQQPDAYPGVLGVFDERCSYQELAEALGRLLRQQHG